LGLAKTSKEKKESSSREGQEETKETRLTSEDENDEEDDVEIVLKMPTKEELEAKRQTAASTTTLNLKTNKTYVKPGLDTAKNEKQTMVPITSTQSVNLEVVGQFHGKDAYELNLENLDEKPWKKPGADLTDYFNYGFNEHTWKQYCQKQLALRAEFGLKKRINVRECFHIL
jgi:pre-mRNA 3'-end-processing factor FIP1